MPNKRGRQVRPLQDVFRYIDMKKGDSLQCWPWQGSLSPNPIFCWNKKRLQAHRVVYALKKGIPVDHVPQLTWTCGNHRCCNPSHIVERYGVEEQLVGYASSRARGKLICSE